MDCASWLKDGFLTRRLVLVMLTCSLLSRFEVCLSATLNFDWKIEYLYTTPDCVQNMVMGINGQFPGPTINAKVGDTIIVNVTNKLDTEGVVIHWHGIKQYETIWEDGTASISQCSIIPEQTFTYKFLADKPGTYFYHGHFGMQRMAGLYGSLIVDVADGTKEPFQYDGDLNILLSDWWHENVQEQETGLRSSNFTWIGEPQSILMNGRGQYDCSLAWQFNTTSKQCDSSCKSNVLNVLPNKTYRLRITSTTSLSALNVEIKNHKMTLVEADGNYINPVTVDNIYIYSGESYSVLFTTNQDPTQNYFISASVTAREPQTEPGLTILNYLPNLSSNLPTSPPPIPPAWNDYNASKSFSNKINASESIPSPPTSFYRRVTLFSNQQNENGYVKWYVNNFSLALPAYPLLGSLTAQSPEGNGVLMLDFNKTVDVILQNTLASPSEVHPWHLHGHDFWVMGYGDGNFSDSSGVIPVPNVSPPLRNTVPVFPNGWTAIRFISDNPGVWAFHCHIEPHLFMGMGVVVAEGLDQIPKGNMPSQTLACVQ